MNSRSLFRLFLSHREIFEVRCWLRPFSVLSDTFGFDGRTTEDQAGQLRRGSESGGSQRSKNCGTKQRKGKLHARNTNDLFLKKSTIFLDPIGGFLSEDPQPLLPSRGQLHLLLFPDLLIHPPEDLQQQVQPAQLLQQAQGQVIRQQEEEQQDPCQGFPALLLPRREVVRVRV